MANEYSESLLGLVTMLRGIEGLDVLTYVSSAHIGERERFPAVIVRPEYLEGADSGLCGGFVVEALTRGRSV